MNNGTKPHPEVETPHYEDADLSPATPIDRKPAASGGGFWKKCVLFGVTGFGVLLVMRSCSSPERPVTRQLPPQPQAIAPSATPQPSPAEEETAVRPDAMLIRRNALLGDAITQTQEQVDRLLCARSEYFLLQAQQELQAKGTAIDAFLLVKLQEVNAKNQQATVGRSSFDGAPETIAQARALNQDSLALLKALEMHYNSTPLTLCAVAPAGSILAIAGYTDTAALLQQRSAQSRLESQIKSQEATDEAAAAIP